MRNKVVIAVVGIAALAALGAGARAIWPVESATGDKGQSSEAAKSIPVVLTTAKEMTFESAVVISGNVQAKNYALVSARIPGPLDAVFVDEGDRVEAMKTNLFQTDSLKLTKALAVARQTLTVAECSVDEARARLEQMLADKEQAERDLKRYEELARGNAVPMQLLEKQQTGYKQATAAVKDIEALVALREAQLEQARLSLAVAQKDLTDSLVVAPISGCVSRRFKEPGEMAGAGTPVVKIEDLSVLEISVFLPEAFYARVESGKTRMRIEVNGIDLGAQPVTYKSPTVDPKRRTFEVKGLVKAPPPGVAPGCLADVTIVIDERKGVGVPSVAIEQRGGNSVVFLVMDEKARKTRVKTGREMSGWTEILEGDVTAETQVVTMGQHLIEDGTRVSVVKEDGR